MGDIIGGILGGVGSIAGAIIQSNAAADARKDALTGYNYLTKGAGAPLINGAVTGGTAANDATQQLLGLKPMGSGTANAFNNYLGSTGYNFQLKQGQDAIASSAASKGLLNSGGTGKALEEYGQGLGANYFNSYLGQLGGVSAGGYNAATAVGNAGTGAGSNAAQYTAAGGNAIANGVSGALGGFGGALTNVLSRGNTVAGSAGVGGGI